MAQSLSKKQEREAARCWLEMELAEAAAHNQPDPDELAQAFRVLFHVPPHVKRLPPAKEQWFLLYSTYVWRKPEE